MRPIRVLDDSNEGRWEEYRNGTRADVVTALEGLRALLYQLNQIPSELNIHKEGRILGNKSR